jgi:uncharacterized integral membrane protein
MSTKETASPHERRIRASQTIRVIVWLVVLVALIVFAARNTDEVDVNWLFDTTAAPLWVVIAVSAVGGAVIGYFARPRHR